jgi:hypothetical protein
VTWLIDVALAVGSFALGYTLRKVPCPKCHVRRYSFALDKHWGCSFCAVEGIEALLKETEKL